MAEVGVRPRRARDVADVTGATAPGAGSEPVDSGGLRWDGARRGRGAEPLSAHVQRLDHVADRELLDHVLAVHDAAEDGVVALEVRLRREREKVLTATGVRT